MTGHSALSAGRGVRASSEGILVSAQGFPSSAHTGVHESPPLTNVGNTAAMVYSFERLEPSLPVCSAIR